MKLIAQKRDVEKCTGIEPLHNHASKGFKSSPNFFTLKIFSIKTMMAMQNNNATKQSALAKDTQSITSSKRTKHRDEEEILIAIFLLHLANAAASTYK
jgi:hypothetical protein